MFNLEEHKTMVSNIEIGDRIKFKPTKNCRYNEPSSWRKVTGFYRNSEKWDSFGIPAPTVRYDGYANFAVYLHEIVELEKNKN